MLKKGLLKHRHIHDIVLKIPLESVVLVVWDESKRETQIITVKLFHPGVYSYLFNYNLRNKRPKLVTTNLSKLGNISSDNLLL